MNILFPKLEHNPVEHGRIHRRRDDVAVDTGIDYTHPFLGGGIGPDYKVLGGKNFTDSGDPDDPMDGHYHGTHVAGIVAANSLGEPGWEDFKGMAPDASLYAVKVLGDDGRGYSSWIISGIEWAVNPGGDLRRADVINMSLGLSYVTSPGYPTALAANAAAEAGVIVVASSGNEGQDWPTSSPPGTGAKVISVGSYGYIKPVFIVVNGEEIRDVRPSDCPDPDGQPHFIAHVGLGRFDPDTGIDDFAGIDLTGKIALIQRGEIAFTEKVMNAQAKGAIAALVYNSEPGGFGMAGEFPIPAFSIPMELGEYILYLMSVNPNLQVTMGAHPPKTSCPFSSAGPANDYSLKPDISPGDAVFSTLPAFRLVAGGTNNGPMWRAAWPCSGRCTAMR